ncbi:MAG: M28 family peptidase [Candidatus Lokiarchaeota archaeon]|nr:M28 family peptidase [Candidatus Lokiarchaeota archaeon]
MFDNNYMLKFIEDVCNDIGPRESGTEQEILAGNKVESELKKFCDETHQEPYTSSPHAFLGGVRYGALMVLVAGVFFWLSLLIDLSIITLNPIFDMLFLILSLILIVAAINYLILEVMKYHEIFDFLFPKRESNNVIGTINPKNEVKNTVIFSAHHDSAFEFNTFYYLKRFGQLIINIGYLGVGIIFIAIILKVVFFFLSIEQPILFLIFGIIFVFFVPIILVYLFFHSSKPVLGAFDNLSGVAILLGIAKFLSENKKNNEIFPKYTRVHLISFAGEEAGLRGAKRYAKAHYDELVTNQTTIVNMDSIAKKDFIVILNKESGIGATHDPLVYEPLLDIAENLNLKTTLLPLPFGATDGAVFSKMNIPTASIGGLNLKEELPPFYHTRNDTPAVIEKEALGQFAQVCVSYLKFIDSQS